MKVTKKIIRDNFPDCKKIKINNNSFSFILSYKQKAGQIKVKNLKTGKYNYKYTSTNIFSNLYTYKVVNNDFVFVKKEKQKTIIVYPKN